MPHYHCPLAGHARSSIEDAQMHSMCAINFYISIISMTFTAAAAAAAAAVFIYLYRTTAARNHLLPERKSQQTTIPTLSIDDNRSLLLSSLFAEPRRFWVARCSASVWNNLLINKKCKKLEVICRPSFVSIETSLSRMMCSSSYPAGKRQSSPVTARSKKSVCLHKALAYIILAGA